MTKTLAKIQILVGTNDEFKQEKRATGVDYLVKDNIDFAKEINADGVLLSDLDSDLSTIRSSHPNLLVGGLAINLADCKNWELKNVDFIQFAIPSNNSKQNIILGSEILQDIIPREEEYGWMILSLNKLVFVNGVTNLEELKSIRAKTNIYGVVLTKQFEINSALEKRISMVSNLFH